MQEFGGFEIRFIDNMDINLAKISVEEVVDEIGVISEQIHVDEGMNRIYVDDDTPMTYDDFEVLFEGICKKVILEQPKSSFNGLAHYSNLSVELEIYQISSYQQFKKELVVEEIYGEYLDGYCPECGARLFNPVECKNQKIYYCSDCCKDFTFDINYRKSAWLLEDDRFVFQNP